MLEGCSSGEKKNLTIRAVDILENGEELHRRDIFGNTALHNELLHGGNLELIECLLGKHADVNAAGYFLYSPLQLAVLGKMHLDLITKLIKYGANLNHKDVSGQTVLHMAVRIGSSKQLLQLLLDSGADVNAKDVRGQTPLHFASGRSRRTEDIKMLIRNGASVCEQDTDGRTPLHFALPKPNYPYNDYVQIAELLLDHGKEAVNMQDAKGRTPVHLSISHRWQYSGILFKMLYLYNGSMAILDNDGKSPLELATCHPVPMGVFTDRALRLKCANLPVEVNYEFDFSYSAKEQETYLKELEMMKLYKFGKYSMHDIISKCNDPAYLNNKEIAEGMQTAVESPDLEKEFPSYRHILKEMFYKGQKRLLLLNRAQEFFLGALPVEIRRLVLSYLSDLDLENWIKANM